MHLKEMYTSKIMTPRGTAICAITRSGFTISEAEEIINLIVTPQKQRQQWTRWTDKDKELLRQCRQEGRSLKETAKALNRTIRQVQSAIARFQDELDSTPSHA